jgi:fatty-acyl-CoA synthase
MSAKTFTTVVHAFADSLENTPDSIAVHLPARSGEILELSYAALYRGARCAANGFKEFGISRGDRLIIALPTSQECFDIYFAALFTGMIPIIVSEPQPNRGMEFYTAQLETLAKIIEARYLVVPEAIPAEMAFFSSLIPVAASTLCRDGEISRLDLVADEMAIAHLQATSGSTSTPKYAIIRHGNISANVHGIGVAIQHRAGDSLVTWLPFSHDMGLIGVSYALFWQCPLIATDPMNFVRNPIFWLRLITRFNGTLSPAPNSAFQVCARLARRRAFEDIDLSSWRVALCGAEPIHEDTIRQFQVAFGPYGFRATTMLPVYGLAETTLAATISDVNDVPLIESIDGDLLETTGRCVPPTSDTKRHVRMVSVGSAIPGHQLRVVNSDGSPMEERQIGEIEFSGPVVIDGYWGSQQDTSTFKRDDGFLRTGDLGYLAAGQLYITGRQKDIIIINGRNFIPAQIEALVEQVIDSNITHGVAACGLQDAKTKTETLGVIIESRILPRPDQPIVEDKVRHALTEVFGLSGVTIHWVGKGEIPKTTSGKIQRYRCRELVPFR